MRPVCTLQKSLSFPDTPGSSDEAKDLIKGLLTDMKTRLTYADIQNHPFFSLTDWNHLLDGEEGIARPDV